MIAEGTTRDCNNLGDVVEVVDDNVELGDSYKHFKIVVVKGLTATQVREELQKKVLTQKMIVTEAAKLEEDSVRKDAYLDGDDWKLLVEAPKHSVNLSIDETKEALLGDEKTVESTKLESLSVAASDNIDKTVNAKTIVEDVYKEVNEVVK